MSNRTVVVCDFCGKQSEAGMWPTEWGFAIKGRSFRIYPTAPKEKSWESGTRLDCCPDCQKETLRLFAQGLRDAILADVQQSIDEGAPDNIETLKAVLQNTLANDPPDDEKAVE